MIRARNADQVSGAIFLIGLGVLFLVDDIDFWPGILFVIAASSVAHGLAEGRGWYSFQGAVWLFGIGVLFLIEAKFRLPVCLIMLGVSGLIGYILRPPMLKR